MLHAPWYVLQVVANHEKKVAQHLAVRSIDHYLPVYSEQSQWSDRVVTVERPLFKGYVFVRFSRSNKLSVISVPGVIRLLGDSSNDTVSAAEIERIREALARGCALRPHAGVAVGTRVRVQSGVFKGAEGIVTELRHRCRVVLALSAVKQCFSLEADLEEIEILQTGDFRIEAQGR